MLHFLIRFIFPIHPGQSLAKGTFEKRLVARLKNSSFHQPSTPIKETYIL